MTDLADRGGVRRKSGPHVPIVEPTDQQWPALACPFLDQGERSFIERFVRMEEGLAESKEANKDRFMRIEDALRYMRNTLIGGIVTILCAIAVSITLASMRSAHEANAVRDAARVGAAQGAKK